MCFKRCVDNLNSRSLDNEEIKFISYNNKLMQHFVEVQGKIMNKRVQEAEEQQKQLEQDQLNQQNFQDNIVNKELSVSS